MHEGAIADISGVIESCEKALSEAEEMAGVTAERAVLGIAGELVRGITHTITYKRSDPEKLITPDEVEMVIEKAQEKSLQKAKNQLSGESGQENLEVRIVNSAIINMSVDGYKVSNPIDFQGSSLTIQLYSAFSPIVHLGALERVAHALNLELIAVAAEPFAVSRTVLGNDPSSALSAFLIDIGAGTTDIAWVDEGGVQATRSFGIGGRTFTKSISDELDIPMEKAELAKLKIGGSDLSGPQKIKVIKALNQTLETWLSGVEICLEEFLQTANKSKGEVSLPNKIMLCGGGASLKMLIKEISETNWYEDINLMNKPKVWLIEPDTAPGFTDETGKVGDHTNITAMGLLRVAIDTLGEEIHAESKLKEGFKRLLKN
jgi:cell division protein FtsA